MCILILLLFHLNLWNGSGKNLINNKSFKSGLSLCYAVKNKTNQQTSVIQSLHYSLHFDLNCIWSYFLILQNHNGKSDLKK